MRGMGSFLGMALLSLRPLGGGVVEGCSTLGEQGSVFAGFEDGMRACGDDEIVRTARTGARQLVLEQAECFTDTAFEGSADMGGTETTPNRQPETRLGMVRGTSVQGDGADGFGQFGCKDRLKVAGVTDAVAWSKGESRGHAGLRRVASDGAVPAREDAIKDTDRGKREDPETRITIGDKGGQHRAGGLAFGQVRGRGFELMENRSRSNLGCGVIPDGFGTVREDIELGEAETFDNGSFTSIQREEILLISIEAFVVALFVCDGGIAAPASIGEILLGGNKNRGGEQYQPREQEQVPWIKEAEEWA